MTWKKRLGRVVLLLLLAELLFFFVLATRVRQQLEGPREYLGALEHGAGKTVRPPG